jgi:hypothetical protein
LALSVIGFTAFLCWAAAAALLWRRWRSPRDHLTMTVLTMAGGVLLGIEDGEVLTRLGLGVSVAIAANFALRATWPVPEDTAPIERPPLPVILLIWSEMLLAVVAVAFWTARRTSLGLFFTGLALISVFVNIVLVLRVDTSYFPPDELRRPK